MVYSIIIICSFGLGFLCSNLVKIYLEQVESEKLTNKVNNIYNNLLENIYSDKTVFISRINNTVSIETNIEDEGLLNIMYMMDKKDVAIFKSDKCIYTSELLDDKILDEVISAIDTYHNDKILDTVNMMGLIFSREDFEKKFNVKVEDLQKNMYGGPNQEISDIDRIKNENENKYNIDDILERITSVGIENLTLEEKEFLDNYNN
jgi:hypothetical protein